MGASAARRWLLPVLHCQIIGVVELPILLPAIVDDQAVANPRPATLAISLLAHNPTWKVWIGPKFGFEEGSGNGGERCTPGAGPWPGATRNASMLNRPTYRWLPRPLPSVSRSPWYHGSPNGAFGSWMMNVSKSV